MSDHWVSKETPSLTATPPQSFRSESWAPGPGVQWREGGESWLEIHQVWRAVLPRGPEAVLLVGRQSLILFFCEVSRKPRLRVGISRLTGLS